ncbi:MAG TPA: hypothetical protein VN611_06435 [Patescibacteria group bacterium]|nr:hypothetical protein [Patescibacteria group bacterium]
MQMIVGTGMERIVNEMKRLAQQQKSGCDPQRLNNCGKVHESGVR